MKIQRKTLLLTASAIVLAAATHAFAADFNIPRGDLDAALDTFTQQSGVVLMVPNDAIRGIRTNGIKGQYSPDNALASILKGTGFTSSRDPSGILAIVRQDKPAQTSSRVEEVVPMRVASAHAAANVETVVVTSSKIKGDIQTVPIAITALSQEQLTSRQIAGGPDLVKEVPNLTFSKTNFSGYTIQIRGIGTQAISVTTDPAVAVALNDTPFIRNHFFEQEFFDVSQVEVLRGPQGTLYGRNATAGVVNVISAKPTDQFEAMLSADIGNYHNRRYEGMVNIPIVDDRLDIRVAGEWTKRDGYTFDTTLGRPVDGRDLWSARGSLRWRPSENFDANLVWEHFSESDGRLRSSKQLCETAEPPAYIDGVRVPGPGEFGGAAGALNFTSSYLSQGCQATSLYAPTAFQVPYGPSLPYVLGLQAVNAEDTGLNPYAETTQSTNLRDIQSAILPHYQAKNDTAELNVDYKLTPVLTFTSQTGYNQDFLYSTEDYNRFDTTPGIFTGANASSGRCPIACFLDDPAIPHAQIFCDPQLGCSDRLVVQDLNDEHAWQLSQEFRLASNFAGPFNFSVGGNYLHYETEENYYVFANALSALALLSSGGGGGHGGITTPSCLFLGRFLTGYQSPNPVAGGGQVTQDCIYIDPNPIGSIDNQGHNYFLSQNPYELNSYALFGEFYYNVASNLKLTAGARWTVDKKRFIDIPSEVTDEGYGYWVTGTIDQKWERPTGRVVLDWTPKLDFTDQTLVYGSVAHGYKAGGANPPGAVFPVVSDTTASFIIHPFTFKPEYINAFELGTKNTLLDGALTFNGDVFYYDYKGYQISEIVDRTAINNNYDAHVEGSEIESSWEPIPGLKFNFAGGWEDTRVAKGMYGIDLMDRTAGMPGWMVVKPFVTQASNCILPDYVVAAVLTQFEANADTNSEGAGPDACTAAYTAHIDPATLCPYVQNPSSTCWPVAYNGGPKLAIPDGYPGFNPTQPDINNGEGFAKNLSGNELPNAPHFTISLGGEYTIPVSEDWAATLHSDFYWQSQSFARIFNDRPYDKIRGYSNVNLALILTSASGWQVMGYLKNVFDTTAITGDFLNSDDTGLTTNVFLTDPRLFGVRVTKNW